MKKAILTASALLLLGCSLTAHALSEPETHDVVNIYEKKELERGTLNEEGEEISFVLVPAKLEAGKYDVEICDNVSPTVYNIRGTDLYVEFRFEPFLTGLEKGVLEWDYESGTFYKSE